MIPGLGGVNPRQMQRMMEQMGIKNTEMKVSRVIFEMEGEKLVFDSPNVTLIEMQGQKSYQLIGEARTESLVNPDDIKMVSEQAGVSEADAKKALEEAGGDIAEAIMKLKK